VVGWLPDSSGLVFNVMRAIAQRQRIWRFGDLVIW
jgi:hypothetical protein